MQDLSSFKDDVTGLAIPAQVLRDLINRQYGMPTIVGKYQVVDPMLNPVPVWPSNNPNSPADLSDISQLVAPDAFIDHDTTRDVHRSLHVVVADPAYLGLGSFPFNPVRHYMKVSQVWTVGGYNFTVPLGYFKFFLPAIETKPGSRMFTWDGFDLTSLVAQCEFLSDWVVRRNYPGGYKRAICHMMTGGAIPRSLGGTGVTPGGLDDAGPGIPRQYIYIDDDPAGTPVTASQTFTAGSNRLKSINQLASAMSFYDLWIDEKAHFRSSQEPFWGNIITGNIKDYAAYVDWDLSPTPNVSIIDGKGIKQDFLNQQNIHNVVRIVGDATTGNKTQTFSATRMNNLQDPYSQNYDPTKGSSAVSINALKSLGGGPQAIAYYEKVTKVSSQAQVDILADLREQEGSQLAEEIVVDSAPIPFFQDHDVVVMNVTDINGTTIIPSSAKAPFISTYWKLPMHGQPMTHKLQRIVVF